MNARMGRKRKQPGDRHKPGKLVRVRLELMEVVERLAKRRLRSPTQMLNDLVLDYLTHLGEWPDDATQKSDGA